MAKKVIYRAVLPAHPGDWTVDTLRQFVQDADAQGISGDTHVKRDQEALMFGFYEPSEGRYCHLIVERIVDLDES